MKTILMIFSPEHLLTLLQQEGSKETFLLEISTVLTPPVYSLPDLVESLTATSQSFQTILTVLPNITPPGFRRRGWGCLLVLISHC